MSDAADPKLDEDAPLVTPEPVSEPVPAEATAEAAPEPEPEADASAPAEVAEETTPEVVEDEDEGDEPEPDGPMRYFRLDAAIEKTTDPSQAEAYLGGGWAEVDEDTYVKVLAAQEAARQVALEQKCEEDRKAEEFRLQNEAAQMPPEAHVTDEIADLPAKTTAERLDRLEAIARSQGYPV